MTNRDLKSKLQRGTRDTDGDVSAVAKMIGCSKQTVYNALNAKRPSEKQLEIIAAIIERVNERKAKQSELIKQAKKL